MNMQTRLAVFSGKLERFLGPPDRVRPEFPRSASRVEMCSSKCVPTQGSSIMASLTNKTALVTGASRGIDRATARALSNAGVHVIIHYGRAAAEADALVAEIRAAGRRADATKADYRFGRALPRLQSRFARLSITTWTSSFPMPVSLRPPPSRITR
jgi:hypothetical protein